MTGFGACFRGFDKEEVSRKPRLHQPGGAADRQRVDRCSTMIAEETQGMITQAERDAQACYIGRRPCGCVAFAAVDDPAHAKDNAKEVAACIREGWTIERQTTAWVREHWGPGCATCEPKKAKKHQSTTQQELAL